MKNEYLKLKPVKWKHGVGVTIDGKPKFIELPIKRKSAIRYELSCLLDELAVLLVPCLLIAAYLGIVYLWIAYFLPHFNCTPQ